MRAPMLTNRSTSKNHPREIRVRRAHPTMALLLALVAAIILASCGANAPAAPSPSTKASVSPSASPSAAPVSPSSSPAASAKPAESAPAKPKEIAKIRIGDRPFVSQLPYHIANDEGLFAAEGIEVSFTMFATGTQNTAALMAGEVDVTASNEESTLNLIGRGADIKAVLTTSYIPKNNKSHAIFVAKQLYDSGTVRKPTDLKGRSIAWIAGWSLLPYALQKSMEAAGIDAAKELDKQTIRENPAKIAALESGAIASAMFSEPWVMLTNSRGVGVPILYIDQPEGLPLSNIAFKESFMKEKRDVVMRFLRAYAKGTERYYAVQADAATKRKYAEKYAKQYGLEVDEMANMDWPAMSRDGSFNRTAAEDWLSWVADNGGVQKKIPFDQWYDPSFVEELKKQGYLK